MMDNFLINTDYNNQKILFETVQTIDVSPPNPGGFYTYSHNLGYVPVARVWYEPDPGQWRPISTRMMQNSSPFTYINVTGTFWVNTQSIEVELRYDDFAPKTCRIWVRVYADD